MPVKRPSAGERTGKGGIAGPNVPEPKTPPLPGHYGGSKSSSYGK